MLNYQSTFSVTPPAALTTPTWNFVGQLIPDPVAFGFIQRTNAEAGQPFAANLLNTQLAGGATYSERMASFLAQGILKWRLAYASVSIYQDGPDLSNQGSLAAAQTSFDYKTLAVCTTSGAYPNQTALAGLPVLFPQSVAPDFTVMQAMPNAYFGQSKFGCYLPLHLDMLEKWRGIHDLVVPSAALSGNGSSFIISNSATPLTTIYPYVSAQAARIDSTGGGLMGTPVSLPCNKKWGSFAAVNLSPNTSFSLFFRMGFEVMVIPSSPLSSIQKISPKVDELALEAYARITRELKDAYPVEYNDLGKLWEVIKGAARVALPVLGQLPVVGPFAQGASALIDMFSRPKPPPALTAPAVRSDAPPAAAVEAVRTQMAAGRTVTKSKSDKARRRTARR